MLSTNLASLGPAGFAAEQTPMLRVPQNQILILRDDRFVWVQSTTEMGILG